MKIPKDASLDVQTAFKEVWDVLRRFDGTSALNLHGVRVENAGSPVYGSDLIRKVDVESGYGFESFYIKLKERGLDGFPGQLLEGQDAIVQIVTSSTAPKATDTGLLFFETDTGVLKFATGSGYTTINYQGISGVYSSRPSASGVADGVNYYATDQNSMYVVNTGAWRYLAGSHSGTTAQRPSLAAGDYGFRYFDTTISAEVYWNGTAWTLYSNIVRIGDNWRVSESGEKLIFERLLYGNWVTAFEMTAQDDIGFDSVSSGSSVTDLTVTIN